VQTFPLRDVLEPWCAAGLTGALRVAQAPGGSVYLLEGRISFAEYPAAADLERMLVVSGRLPDRVWRAANEAGAADSSVGEQIVHTGLLTWAELEAATATAVFDAALYLFDIVAPLAFEPGVRHPLGQRLTWDLDSLREEVDRRKLLLTEAWPESNVDVSAIVPQRQLRGHSVALTALQWDIITNADRCRNPMELAALVGRDTFSVVLEARRMVRAGLLEHSRVPAAPPAPPLALVPRVAEPAATPAPAAQEPGAPLPRRPQSTMDRNGKAVAGVPEEVLTRVIAGLDAA
jgi:hypothetical protein